MADRLIEAMTKSAARQYGRERVNELAHALQCAELAEGAGADEEIVLACLLHDVGRYAVAQEGISDTLEPAATRAGRTRGHHEAGADLIAPYVPERVAFLVRAHTDAKRYLCASRARLLRDALRGLEAHADAPGRRDDGGGGRAVERHPWWPDAVRLRRWDDAAKVVGKQTRPLSSWEPLVRKYFSRPRAAR